MRFLAGAFVLFAGAGACVNPDTDEGPGQTAVLLRSIPDAAREIGDENTFAAVGSAALVSQGRIVVTDPMNMHLSLFEDGRLVDQVGGRGEGPSEFLGLGTVASFGHDTVVVIEPPRGRILLFHIAHDALDRIGPVELPFWARDICSTGDRLFVLGELEENLIHEVDAAGTILQSFAPREEGSNPIATALQSTASLACSARVGAVAFGQRTLGGVRVFTLDGEPIHNGEIPNFSRTVYEGDGGAFRPRRPDVGYAHSVAGVHWFGDGLLVSLVRASGPADGVQRFPEARWWSLEDGWADDVADWPRVLTSSDDGELFLAIEDPYPVIQVVELR